MPKITTFFCRLALLMLFVPFPAAANGNGDALLWKISGNGLTADSYLFGTMHTKDSRVFEFSDATMKALDTCSAFAMEVSLDDNLQERIFDLMIMEENYSIHDYLDEKEYALVNDWFKTNYGLDLSLFELVKPIFLYMLVATAEMEGSEPMFLDEYLYRRADDAGKTIIGIEQAEEQMNALDAIPLEEQFDLLLQSLKHQKKDAKQMEKLIRLYTQQKLDKIARFLERTSYSDDIYAALITNRNKVMASRIETFIRQNAVFIAVGAGHLPGQSGLITLLRQQGFKVEPVQ